MTFDEKDSNGFIIEYKIECISPSMYVRLSLEVGYPPAGGDYRRLMAALLIILEQISLLGDVIVVTVTVVVATETTESLHPGVGDADHKHGASVKPHGGAKVGVHANLNVEHIMTYIIKHCEIESIGGVKVDVHAN